MKKLVVIFGLLISSILVGYTLTTTMTDIFATGNDGSGGPLVRMDSSGYIYATGATFSGVSTFTGAVTQTGVMTFTNAPVSTSGKYGYGPLVGSTIYTVEVATTIAPNGTYSFTLADGKAGSYTILAGTHSAVGTFTSAAVISINVAGTSADTTPIAVTDGGSVPLLTNGAAATSKTYMVTYKYVN